MKKNIWILRIWIVSGMALSSLLAACGEQEQSVAGSSEQIAFGEQVPVAWLDTPLNESHLPLAPYLIVFHITDPKSASMGELTINGEVAALINNPETGSKVGTLQYTWEPAEPGVYTIQVRARDDQGNWSDTDEAVVYVGELVTPSPSPAPILETEEPISDVSATPLNGYIGTCTPNQVTISATAIDPDGIQVVVLFYRFRSSGGGTTEWKSEAMNPKGADQYQKTVSLTTAAEALGFSSTQGTLEYQIVIQDVNNEMIRGDVRKDVTVSTCAGYLLPLEGIERQHLDLLIPTKTPIVIK